MFLGVYFLTFCIDLFIYLSQYFDISLYVIVGYILVIVKHIQKKKS